MVEMTGTLLLDQCDVTDIVLSHLFTFCLCLFESGLAFCLDLSCSLFSFYGSIPSLTLCVSIFDFWSWGGYSLRCEVFADDLLEFCALCWSELAESEGESLHLTFYICTTSSDGTSAHRRFWWFWESSTRV